MSKNWWSFETTESCYSAQHILKKLTAAISGLDFDASHYAWQQETRGALCSIHSYLNNLFDAVEKASILSDISELKKSLSRIIPDCPKFSVSEEHKHPRIPQNPTLNCERIFSTTKECEGGYDEGMVGSIFPISVKVELEERVVLVFNADRAEHTE